MGTSTERLAAEQRAIENCHVEPIHLLGTVQPFGWMMAVDPSEFVITHISANVADFVDVTVEQLLGQPIQEVVSREAHHAIRNVAGHSTIHELREPLGKTTILGSSASFDMTMHRNDVQVILEFQVADDGDLTTTIGEAQRLLSIAGKCESLDDMLASLVYQLRVLTRYDRVKVYQFLPDGAGEIVAESAVGGVDSFLGLRFPAFDIPAAARKLYTATPIRLISDINAAQPPIVGATADAGEVDMSLALLRGTHHGHVAYLQNMGVEATMSLPIVVDGEMWGLFALHNYAPTAPPAMVTMACELVGRAASIMIQGVLQRRQAERVEHCTAVAAELFVADDSPLGFSSYWETARTELASLLQCNGVALLAQERVDVYGDCPPVESIRHIVKAVAPSTPESSESDDPRQPKMHVELQSILPDLDLGPSAGVLVLPSPIPFIDAIAFFRNPSSLEVRWAGNVDLSFEETTNGLRLTPRGSFDEYVANTENRSDDWSVDDVAVATGLQQAFGRVHASNEAHQRHRDRLGLMVRELNHRVRNILALVKSLVGQTQNNAESLTDYVESLERRIMALAGAHDLLTESDWHAIPLKVLLGQTLGAYQDGQDDRITLEGPSALVKPNLASMLSLVFHELASNAAKYGALSTADGTVAVTWSASEEGSTLRWVESGGPSVVADPTAGFGTSIVENALPFEFGATADLRFDPAGVQVNFVFPAEVISLVDSIDDVADENAIEGGETLAVMIVEDDYIISRDSTALVEAAGDEVVAVEPTVAGALSRLETERFDLVLLDVNLRGEFSDNVALRLTELGIPFVFLTGYGSKDQELQTLDSLGIITKPLTEAKLAEYVAMARHQLAHGG